MEKACSRHTQRQDVLHPPVGKFSFRVGARPVGWSPLPWDGGGS